MSPEGAAPLGKESLWQTHGLAEAGGEDGVARRAEWELRLPENSPGWLPEGQRPTWGRSSPSPLAPGQRLRRCWGPCGSGWSRSLALGPTSLGALCVLIAVISIKQMGKGGDSTG